jgi:hypothetical protein
VGSARSGQRGSCARTTTATAVRGPGTAAGLRRARPPPQAPATPAQPADMNDRLAQLKQLGELLLAGILTQAEFDQQKARIPNG